ncbi:hypothetical protein [Sphingomonas sp. KR3-1]|uniref:hypothetical protein n=1 Tax=Sphingomonas sp. KR3-1 TaxID=3156611 RepID=UPI0032B36EF9
MVQLVFVHGVATRSGPAYAVETANRDRLFRDVLFAGSQVEIRSPLWGDIVPPGDERVFAGANGVGTFGSNARSPQALAALTAGSMVSAFAQENGAAVTDGIYAAMIEQADAAERPLDDNDVALFKAAADSWGSAALPATDLDDALVMHLEQDAPASYSLGGRMKAAVGAIADRLRNGVSGLVFNAVRDELSPAIAKFLGDVFVYLKQDESRSRIQATIRQALLDAKAAGGPLVVIGHSLGGVILTDMLFDPAAAGLPSDFRIDALITVGSQPGLFDALGLFDFPHPAAGPAPGPACVGTWFNVFDPIDPLAFRADPRFLDAQDLVFDSVTGLASAHTTYFKRPQFYARTRARLHALGLI